MATLTITLESACGGGGHLDIGVRLDGGAKRIIALTRDDIETALDQEGRDAAVAALLKLYAVGKTRAQVRNALIAGVEVAI